MTFIPNNIIKVIHSDNINGYGITEEDTQINNVISISTTNDVNNLTQTAQVEITKKDIILPKKGMNYISYLNITSKLYYGDKIEIYLGYNGMLEQVFSGYFVEFEVTPTTIKLNLQDMMYFWKKQPQIQFSYDSITMKNLLKSMEFNTKLPNTWSDDNIIDFALPKIRTTDYLTPVEILKMLKDNYGFFAYYNMGKLYVGHKYPLNTIISQTNSDNVYVFDYPYFDFVTSTVGKTIYKSNKQEHSYPIIKNNLKKQYVETKLVVVVSVTQSDNSKQVYYMSDITNGKVESSDELPDIYKSYNKSIINEVNLSPDDAKQMVIGNYNNYPTEHYTGSFTTFGFPTLYPNDTILLSINDVDSKTTVNSVNLDINYFLVEKVIRKYDIKTGYIQNVFIDANYLSEASIKHI